MSKVGFEFGVKSFYYQRSELFNEVPIGLRSLTCVVSSFRRAFAPFHSFTLLVLTRGFKRASPSRIKGPGDLGFKERVMLRGYRACFDSWL